MPFESQLNANTIELCWIEMPKACVHILKIEDIDVLTNK